MDQNTKSGAAVAHFFFDELEKIALSPFKYVDDVARASDVASRTRKAVGSRYHLGAFGIGTREHRLGRAAERDVRRAKKRALKGLDSTESGAYRAARSADPEERDAALKYIGEARLARKGVKNPGRAQTPQFKADRAGGTSSAAGSAAKLGVGALAGAGAGMYGLHKWNNRDQYQGY